MKKAERWSAQDPDSKDSLVVGLTQLISPLFLTKVSHLRWRIICFQNVRISHSTGLPVRVRLGNAEEPDSGTSVSTLTTSQGAVKA